MLNSSFLLLFLCCIAQDSRLLTGPSREQITQGMEQDAKWAAAKKLTYLLSTPSKPPSYGMEIAKIEEGWKGELSYWDFSILSIIDEDECLLILGSGTVIWLKNYPTKELTTDMKVRVVGPVVAKETKSYESAIGAKRTTRVIEMISDKEKLREFQDNESRKESESKIKEVIMVVIWGDSKRVPVASMTKQQLSRYRNLLDKTKKMVDTAKVVGGTSVIGLDKGKLQFDTEESKAIALDEVKKLSSQLPTK